MNQDTDEELRKEAGQLLGSGLRAILNDYGHVHIVDVDGFWQFLRDLGRAV